MAERKPTPAGGRRATPAKRPSTGIPGLTPEHLRTLRNSGISDEVIKARGYRSVTNEGGPGLLSPSEMRRFGFAEQQRLPGLLIPSFDADGHPSMYQLRPDKSRPGGPKYITPKGHALRLDFPPGCNVFPSDQLQLGDMSVPIVFTEGVKKVDAATSNGLLCIGLMGVDGWSGPAARRDFDRIPMNKRQALIAFDSDVMTKPAVQASLERFEDFLSVRGAKVHRVTLPSSLQDAPDPVMGEDPDKVGLDDYFAAGYARGDFLALTPIVDDTTPPVKFMTDVQSKEVSWFWYGYLPFGKISIIEGDQDVGKSLCTSDLAATATVGGRLPDGTAAPETAVLLLSAEDDAEDTGLTRPTWDGEYECS